MHHLTFFLIPNKSDNYQKYIKNKVKYTHNSNGNTEEISQNWKRPTKLCMAMVKTQ